VHSTADALRSLLSERRAETDAVLALVQRVASGADVATIAAETVSVATALTGCAGGLIYLLDEDTQRLWVRAGSSGYESWVGNYALEIGVGLTGWTALNRAPAVIADDAQADPRYLLVPELRDESFQSVLCYPLVSGSDRLVGVITLHTQAPHEFTQDDLALVAPIAALCAAAVDNARLRTERGRHVAALRALVASGAGEPSRALHDLCEAARVLIGGDAALIAIRDANGRYTNGAITGWRRAGPVTQATFLEPLSQRLTLLSSGRQSALADAFGAAAKGVAAPLRAAGHTVGVLVAVGADASVPPAVAEVFEALATSAAQVILNQRLADQVARRNAEPDFITSLISGDEPVPVLEARARRLGVDLDARHVAMICDTPVNRDPDAAASRLREQLRLAFPGSVCARRGAQIAALVRVRDDRGLTRRLAELAPAGTGLAAGVSRPRSATTDYAAAFIEADQALRIGGGVHAEPAVTAYADLGAQRYLWALAQEPARDVWQERLERLWLNDQERGGRLFETVEAYLDANGNRRDAAAKLFVHRNTLRQRLERIRRVAAIDLEDTALLFELQVAVRIVRARQRIRRGEPAPR
jgi:sugar diacid utilization regulator/putative methionine-R-sulfoxide reductase with GAF domain